MDHFMEKNLSFLSKGAKTYHSNLPMTMTAGFITDILSSCCRFGYFVFKQPRRMDYSTEGGYTDSCGANMSNGRGPFRFDIRHKFTHSRTHKFMNLLIHEFTNS